MNSEIDEATRTDIVRVLLKQSREYVAAIYWSYNATDAQTILHNGSCFFLQIDQNLFGVTANHVYEAYIQAKEEHPELVLLIHNTIIQDFETRIIDRDQAADILTFSISSDELKQIDTRPYSCPINRWPPKPAVIGNGVIMAGYAEADRAVMDSKNVEFLQTSNFLIVAGIDEDKIEIQIEQKNLSSFDGHDLPSITKNLSGNSGAPLWTVSSDLHENFRLGGIIISQFPPKSEEEAVVIFAKRPEFILADGKLNRDENGRCKPKYRE